MWNILKSFFTRIYDYFKSMSKLTEENVIKVSSNKYNPEV